MQVSQNKFFPEANSWMWGYCTYLGSVVVNDKPYDLGYVNTSVEGLCYAIVYGNEPGKFMSGMHNPNTSVEVKQIANVLLRELNQ